MARRFGYSRVSTSDQDWSLQLEALTKAGVDDRDIFRETASGANRDRTELRRVLDQLRPGIRPPSPPGSPYPVIEMPLVGGLLHGPSPSQRQSFQYLSGLAQPRPCDCLWAQEDGSQVVEGEHQHPKADGGPHQPERDIMAKPPIKVGTGKGRATNPG